MLVRLDEGSTNSEKISFTNREFLCMEDLLRKSTTGGIYIYKNDFSKKFILHICTFSCTIVAYYCFLTTKKMYLKNRGIDVYEVS